MTSWNIGTNTYLATEPCRPLAGVLPGLSDMEICLGLKSVLGALIFLVEQAKTRHLNVAANSIYVNQDGQWKLFGFEHLWKVTDVTDSVHEKSKPYRYGKACDSNEAIEQFAFGVLCEDVLKERKEVPHTEEFIEYCKAHLKHADTGMRPSLQAVLLHPYFNHDFIQIHSYLTELPLKNSSSKEDFFTHLTERLREFDEEVVATQLGCLLLSRIVLLDPTSKICFIPNFLRPHSESFDGLFSAETFKDQLIPRIKSQFSERDAQIRIALLEYFPTYVELFTKDDLAEILPQLLLGLKDTNDFLVSRTLYCMADLVPILGATAVVGSDRTRIFSDGRPQGPDTETKYSVMEPRSITPVLSGASVCASDILDAAADVSGSYDLKMPERPSPDGEEIPTASEVEVDEWSDWEGEREKQPSTQTPSEVKIPVKPVELDELDIKSQKVTTQESQEEFDYFKDMEPVIHAAKLVVMENDSTENPEDTKDTQTESNSRLNLTSEVITANGVDHGWDTDDNWGE